MSGFFGVTNLGPSKPFESNLLSTMGITSFNNEEFKVGFDSLSNEGTVAKVDV